HGVALEPNFANLTRTELDSFTSQWPGPNRPLLIKERDFAFSLRRGFVPQVRLLPSPPGGNAEQDVRWLVGPRHVDWNAAVRLTPSGTEGDWLFLEWELQTKQTVTVSSVVARKGAVV